MCIISDFGETRIQTESPFTSLSLCFESVPWTHEDMAVFAVLNGLLGSAKGFSMGGPGKGMYSRATQNIFQRYQFIVGVDAINQNFTDSGIFGLNVKGHSTNAGDLGTILVNELKGLKQGITDLELQRAKNIFKINILMALERQEDRLEEATKNVFPN